MTEQEVIDSYITELRKHFGVVKCQEPQKSPDSGTQSFWMLNQIEYSKTIRKSINSSGRKPSKRLSRALKDDYLF